MCLYPRKYINQKYTATEKNGGNIPLPPIIGHGENGNIYDERVLYVQIPCGRCIECCKQKASAWRVRMIEELRMHKYNYFVTLTFSNEELKELMRTSKLGECNALAAKATRRHLERWRKNYKCQLKHWYITELGHENTERIHMHGIIFSDTDISCQFERIERVHGGWRCNWKYWKYGHIWVGDYCNERSCNYIVKYMTKIDTDHKNFYGQVLCSPGIGKNYTEKDIFNTYRYIRGESRSDYRLQNGVRVKLPTYYKNKGYNEEERELIWRDTMDQDKSYIMGHEYDHRYVPQEVLGNVLTKAQEINHQMGYGDDSDEWKKKKWNITERMLRRAEIKRELEEKLAKMPKITKK